VFFDLLITIIFKKTGQIEL